MHVSFSTKCRVTTLFEQLPPDAIADADEEIHLGESWMDEGYYLVHTYFNGLDGLQC